MRRVAVSLGLLAFVLFAAPLHAGLYNMSEPEEGNLGNPDSDPRKGSNFLQVFRNTILTLRSIGADKVEVDNPLRMRYVLTANLAEGPLHKLSWEDKLNLSAVLVRRKKVDAAVRLLEDATRERRDNFLLLANLATAYQLMGQPDFDQRAISTLQDALTHWPANLSDLPQEKQNYFAYDSAYAAYREAETYQLKLLKLRLRESRAEGKKAAEYETVDALFDGGKVPSSPLKFVGPSGAFEPGRIAADQRDKLPPDAVAIVQRLLVWMPEDLRLYWLLGELLNARGDIAGAKEIFKELAEPAPTADGFSQPGKHRPKIMVEHWHALKSIEVNDSRTDEVGKSIPDFPPPIVAETPSAMRPLVVGFATGLAVGIFAVWQFREMRRRKAQRRST